MLHATLDTRTQAEPTNGISEPYFEAREQKQAVFLHCGHINLRRRSHLLQLFYFGAQPEHNRE